jgi:hypothetical protein
MVLRLDDESSAQRIHVGHPSRRSLDLGNAS